MNNYTNYVRWMINNQTPRPEPRDARTEWDEIGAAQDLVENKITPEEERIERAYQRDIAAFVKYLCAYAKTQPAFALYHVAHWCECGTLISHSQGAFDAHKGHGGFINIDLGGAA